MPETQEEEPRRHTTITGTAPGAKPISALYRLTVLVEKLQDGRLLGVEEKRRHVIVGVVWTEECSDAGIHFVGRGDLKRETVQI